MAHVKKSHSNKFDTVCLHSIWTKLGSAEKFISGGIHQRQESITWSESGNRRAFSIGIIHRYDKRHDGAAVGIELC